MCEYIYIYIMYIYVYTITREKVTTRTMCFFSSFVLIIHRVCVRGPRVPLNIPLLSCGTERRLVKILSLFFSFSSPNKNKKRGTRKKCIHTKLRARRVVFCKYARRREHGNASFTFNSNHDILLRIVKKQR